MPVTASSVTPMHDRTTKEIAAAAKAERKAQLAQLRDLIRALDTLIDAEPDDVMRRLDMAVLRGQRADLLGAADQIEMQLRSREWLYIGLLQRAENESVNLSYSASTGKPHGPGIDYLIAAAAKYGQVIGPDRAHAIIKRFNRLSQDVAKLRKIVAELGIKSELKAHAMILRDGQLIDE
jgi:hypothetical protein